MERFRFKAVRDENVNVLTYYHVKEGEMSTTVECAITCTRMVQCVIFGRRKVTHGVECHLYTSITRNDITKLGSISVPSVSITGVSM